MGYKIVGMIMVVVGLGWPGLNGNADNGLIPWTTIQNVIKHHNAKMLFTDPYSNTSSEMNLLTQPDESTDSIVSSQTVQTGTTFNITAYYSNQGSTVDTFNVYLDIYDTTGTLISSYSGGPYVNPVGGWISHTFVVSGLSKGFYWINVYHDLSGDGNTANDTLYWHVLALNHPGNQILVTDFDPALYNPNVDGGGYQGQSAIKSAMIMDDLGYMVDYRWMEITSPSPYAIWWIAHGVYDYLVVLPSSLRDTIFPFLNNGGRAYAEGGDIWSSPSVWENGYNDLQYWDTFFGVSPNYTTAGAGDLYTIQGIDNRQIPWVYGHTWVYYGENNSIDRLWPFTLTEPIYPDPYLQQGDGVGYTCGLAFTDSAFAMVPYHTVANSFEVAFIQSTSMQDADVLLIENILSQGLHENPTIVSEMATEYNSATLRVLGTELVFTLPERSDVILKLYDKAGRMLSVLANGTFSPGSHSVSLNSLALPKGIYIARMKTNRITTSMPVIILHE